MLVDGSLWMDGGGSASRPVSRLPSRLGSWTRLVRRHGGLDNDVMVQKRRDPFDGNHGALSLSALFRGPCL